MQKVLGKLTDLLLSKMVNKKVEMNDKSNLKKAIQILFLGNSYTYYNAMPKKVALMARHCGFSLTCKDHSEDGCCLADLMSEEKVMTDLKQYEWDFIVLQEQSQIPVIPDLVQWRMISSIEKILEIKNSDSQIVVFETWARENGGIQRIKGQSSKHFPNFDTMQDEISRVYQTIATKYNLKLAPVGEAWRAAKVLDLPLWLDDGSHPSVFGSYLAACTLFYTFYQDYGDHIPYYDSLSKQSATALQEIALYTVRG